MRLVLFDIDGTLVTGASTEKRFMRLLFRRGLLGPWQLLAAAHFILRWSARYGRHVFKKNKAYLNGLDYDRVSTLAANWVDQGLSAAWFESCVQRLKKHVARGDQVVLVSGSPEFLARAIAARLGVARVVGTVCEVSEGRFRAGLPAIHPFGPEKADIARELAREYGVSRDRILAYGDSIHDISILDYAGKAVAVRPDDQLYEVALERGWEILGSRTGHDHPGLSGQASP